MVFICKIELHEVIKNYVLEDYLMPWENSHDILSEKADYKSNQYSVILIFKKRARKRVKIFI